jgi:hypothetical protein
MPKADSWSPAGGKKRNDLSTAKSGKLSLI